MARIFLAKCRRSSRSASVDLGDARVDDVNHGKILGLVDGDGERELFDKLDGAEGLFGFPRIQSKARKHRLDAIFVEAGSSRPCFAEEGKIAFVIGAADAVFFEI